MTNATRGRTLIIALTDEDYDRYQHWTECAAFRVVDVGDGTARLELTDDLDRITAPEDPA